MERSLTILNEFGDHNITWTPDQDDAMEEIIAKKMAAGVTFYVIPKRATGKPKKLKEAAEARKHRALSIPDADLSKFVLEGKGEVVCVPAPERIEGAKRAKTAKEVASGHSVGVQPRRGG